MAFTDKYAVVGSSGYGIYLVLYFFAFFRLCSSIYSDLITGIVHVMAPQEGYSEWSEVTTLTSPIADIGNFGTAVHMDEANNDTIIIGANAYSKYSMLW